MSTTRRSLSNASSVNISSSDSEEHLATCWWCRRSTFRLIVYVFFLTAYLCGGALCFMWIESPYETEERVNLRRARATFLQRHRCVSDRDLEEFIQQVVHASDRGVSVANNATVSEANWSFGQSIFFSTTVVTTVGYGRTAPLSQGGKLFCVFFALVGIPLTLILFTAIIERLTVVSHVILDFLQRKLPSSFRFVFLKSEFHMKVTHLSIVLFIHVGIFTLIPAAIFNIIEKDWSYLDSVYFCFISWTTVGLGDFVPGEHHQQKLRPLYKIVSSMYLFLSLISMLFVLKAFHDTPHLNLGLRIYMHSDHLQDEELPLRPGDSGPKYTRQVNEPSSTADTTNRRPSVQLTEVDGQDEAETERETKRSN